MKNDLNGILRILNIITGGVVVLSAIYLFLGDNSNLGALYIALAIIFVGPLEDYLTKLINEAPLNKTKKKELLKTVDLTTSLVFLLLLGLTLIELSPSNIHGHVFNKF